MDDCKSIKKHLDEFSKLMNDFKNIEAEMKAEDIFIILSCLCKKGIIIVLTCSGYYVTWNNHSFFDRSEIGHQIQRIRKKSGESNEENVGDNSLMICGKMGKMWFQ